MPRAAKSKLLTVTLTDEDMGRLDKKARERGFQNTSEYVRHLMAQDGAIPEERVRVTGRYPRKKKTDE